MKELASLSGDERKQHAEKLNKIKDSVLEIIASKTEELNSEELEKKLNSEMRTQFLSGFLSGRKRGFSKKNIL